MMLRQFCFVVVLILGLSFGVYGKNALYFVGVDTPSAALGGTAVADPQGISSSIYVNPATMGYFSQYQLELNFIGHIDQRTLDGENNKSIFHPMGSVSLLFPVVPGQFYVGIAALNPVYEAVKISSAEEKLLKMTFAFSFAYKFSNLFSLGISLEPILQNYTFKGTGLNVNSSNWAFGLASRAGISLDFGLVRIGGFFRYPFIAPKHKIGSTQISLQLPMQAGGGLSLRLFPFLSIYIDAKGIFWKKAKGWKDRYKDQIILASGVQVGVARRMVLRGGYNFSTKANLSPTYLYPSHYISFGLGTMFGEYWEIDLSFALNLKNTEGNSSYQGFEVGLGWSTKI